MMMNIYCSRRIAKYSGYGYLMTWIWQSRSSESVVCCKNQQTECKMLGAILTRQDGWSSGLQPIMLYRRIKVEYHFLLRKETINVSRKIHATNDAQIG